MCKLLYKFPKERSFYNLTVRMLIVDTYFICKFRRTAVLRPCHLKVEDSWTELDLSEELTPKILQLQRTSPPSNYSYWLIYGCAELSSVIFPKGDRQVQSWKKTDVTSVALRARLGLSRFLSARMWSSHTSIPLNLITMSIIYYFCFIIIGLIIMSGYTMFLVFHLPPCSEVSAKIPFEQYYVCTYKLGTYF
jgi:hypothetical protein